MRYSNAFSSLNSLRNIIEYDGAEVMEKVEKDIILDAVEIAIDKTEESFTKALMYGFYNTGDTIKSSAVELAKVISDGVTRGVISEDELKELRTFLMTNNPLNDKRLTLISKIDKLMILLNKAKKEIFLLQIPCL